MHQPRPLVRLASRINYRLALNARTSLPVQRRLIEAGAGTLRPPKGSYVEHVTLAGRAAERVSYGASERPRAVLYLHGGGYTLGSPRLYRGLAGYLARSAGAVVFTLDYRMAPEHVFPAALDDAVAAFRALVDEHGFAPKRIAIAGDSAGGGLAVAAARVLVDAGLEPGALVLLSPWTDPTDDDTPLRDFVTTRAWGTKSGAAYRGNTDPHDPGFAPMYAKLSGLPPMLVHFAPSESLAKQIGRFVERACEQGADVTVVELPRLWHSAHVLAGALRDATNAVHDVGVYVRAHLG